MSDKVRFSRHPISKLDSRYVNVTGDTMTGMLSYQSNRSIADLYHVVDKKYVDEAVTALGARYYMLDTDSGEADYKLCSLTASSDTEKSVSGTNLSDGDYIAGWISPNTNEPDRLIAGVYNWRVYAEKTGGNKTLRLYWKLVERKSDDSETVIGTSVVSNEITTGKNSYIIPLTLSADHEVASDSYVVGKLYADVSGSGNAPSVALYYEGDSDSHWEIPVNTEILDNSYVNVTGDTMTGALTINADLTVDTDTLYIDSTNHRVGIGTTTPLYPLHIESSSNINLLVKTTNVNGQAWVRFTNDARTWQVGESSADSFSIKDTTAATSPFIIAAAAPSNAFTIQGDGDVIMNAGNVGIGTTSPNALLHLQSDTAGTNVIFQQDVNTGSGFSFTFRKSRGTESSPSKVFNNDIIGDIAWKPYDGSNYGSEGARIRGAIDGGTGVDDVPMRLTFWTATDGANSPTERMRINSAGDVAIGIAATPSAQLHVDQSSTTGAQPVLLLDQADVSEEFIKFVGSAAAGVLTQSIVNASDVTTATVAGYLRVYVQDDGNQITDQAYYVPIYTLS